MLYVDIFRPSLMVILAFTLLQSEMKDPVNQKKKIYFDKYISDETTDKEKTLSFLTSLSLESPSDCCHPEAVKYVKNFNKHKVETLDLEN